MHVADRFYLHKNLLDAITMVLNREIPATITIPHEIEIAPVYSEEEATDDNKKWYLMWIAFLIFIINVIN
ncbi:MAG: hypothetical protein K0R92_2300 [Lachnospiraceae bacterium]|jgi:hypothetical protein|nr:hypothetical protein [Lachnospiraceae bacterium]